MRVRLGRYSIKRKTYSYTDLGLNEAYKNMLFKFYVQVFHLWYIPILPVGKFWVVVDRDTKKEVVLNPEVRTILNLKELKSRYPFWSYIGAFIISLPVLFLIGLLVLQIINYSDKQLDKQLTVSNRIEQVEEGLENIELDDELSFKTFELKIIKDKYGAVLRKEKQYYTPTYKYVVTMITNDSIQIERKFRSSRPYRYTIYKKKTLSKQQLQGMISKTFASGQNQLRKDVENEKDFMVLFSLYEINKPNTDNSIN
ncbi:hypothetical protein [Spongiivirga citrea]|uniref:Uncharacterized protein n=1 Tax=Spongiivirga citrea TaxID=1481457 RepID=A0A6M0CD30_9FLAO|nr:hypothetical protein [Spongiivirga citrea]NER15685.1 hypothetical protein [Spongiivirga citrea]